ncbi:MAG: hypothetical protein ACJ75Z_03460 [Solirubrobacterales bacterium]
MRWVRLASLSLAAALAAVWLTACGTSATVGPNESASANPKPDPACARVPDAALTPPGGGAEAYTMGIRVNGAGDVDEIESAIGDRIQDRDVFVINTEFPHSAPDDWQAALDRLTEKFPCNRVVTLTGLSQDPGKPKYEYALVGNPELDGVLMDWEPDTWEDAGRGHWTPELETNLTRIAEELRLLSRRLASTKTRMGLVPDYVPPWDYGRTAREIALANLILDPAHRGYQLVQTQPNCGTSRGAGPPIGLLAAQLIAQYRGLFGESLRLGADGRTVPITRELLRHLGFEVAFDTTPNPKASEAVERIGPKQAAACSWDVVKAGGAGILYWASPDSLRALLDTPVGKKLRPSSS